MVATPEAISAAFEASWNAHDLAAFRNLFWPEATFVNRFATFWDGVDAIVEGHRQIHATVYSDSVIAVDVPDLRMLSDDICVAHIWSRLNAGHRHPRGPHQADTLIMAVMMRRGDDWRIIAAENVTLIDPRSGSEVLRAGHQVRLAIDPRIRKILP